MNLFVFLLSLGAALRLTRLAIQDEISAPIRRFLTSRPGRFGHWAQGLLTCPWCTGFWVSAGTTAALVNVTQITQPLWYVYPGLTLATSWLVGFLFTAAYTLEIWEPNGTPHQHG